MSWACALFWHRWGHIHVEMAGGGWAIVVACTRTRCPEVRMIIADTGGGLTT